MGDDKAALEWHGQPLVIHCHDLLGALCARVITSIRPTQAESEHFRGYSLVLDDPEVAGPAAGLLAAWSIYPESALLVLAVDMPLVDARTLNFLISNRDSARIATAYRHPNRILEPLCTIWEPTAAGKLRQAVEAHPAPSLRQILENGPIVALDPPEPARIVSCNTPEAFAAAQELRLTC